MILYAIPVSTYSAKVRIALGIKGIDYEMVPPPGGYSSPEYKAIVPVGTIPGLKDGDFVISESEVITEYLEEKYPAPSLLAGNAEQRAHQRFLARFHDLWLEPHLRATFAHVDPANRDADALEACLDRYQARLEQLESLVDPAPWLGGGTIGVADCAFPATFTLADIMLEHFGRESRYGPKLQAWRETVYAHPVVAQVTDESRRATIQWMGAG